MNFTPPVIYEVPTQGRELDLVASRLFSYYRPRQRGVTVYKMDDGTYWVGREVLGLSGPHTEDAWPPVPVKDQVNGAIVSSWHYSREIYHYTQTPGVVTVYYGGTTYPVSNTEAAALIAAGFGAYVE